MEPRRVYGYAGTSGPADAGCAADLARRGAVWVPGPRVQAVDPGIRPGDVLLLFHRDATSSAAATFLGAGVVADPGARRWGGVPWLETVRCDDPLYRSARDAGYGGPPNYMTMAPLERFTERPEEVRELTGDRGPHLHAGDCVVGLPTRTFVFPLDVGALQVAESSEAPLLERIVQDPGVLLGKPTVRGTRIAVEHVLAWLSTGTSPERLLADFPQLSLDDVRACLVYARTVVERVPRPARVRVGADP